MVNWAVLPMAFGGIIVLIVFTPILDLLISTAFSQLDASTAHQHVNLIKIALGSVGFLIVLGFMGNVVNGFRGESQQQYGQ